MSLTTVQLIMMIATIALIIGAGIWSARKIKSAEGFSLNGRKSSTVMVAGAIAGSCIGGGATIGTAQSAFMIGISAWWFTIGIGVGFACMALFFAKKFRESGKETITQLLMSRYGRSCGPVASVIASCGIFFAAVASVLPAIFIISHLLNISVYFASVVLFLLITVYIYFGGLKGAGTSGLIKSIILWMMLLVICWTAGKRLFNINNVSNIIPHGFDPFATGINKAVENVVSMTAGLVCAQNYAQAIFAATDSRTAQKGCIIASVISLPVGLPCVLASMYMKATHPDVLPIMALPEFIIRYMPESLAGITLGVLIIALISSVAGLTLGISTLLTRDIWSNIFHLRESRQILRANRLTVIAISTGLIVFSLFNLESQVLMWNLLALALRAGIFIPLVLALYQPKLLPPLWAIPAMLIGTMFAGTANHFINTGIPPLIIGFMAAAIIIAIGATWGKNHNYQLLHLLAKTKKMIQR